jgi:hypothetical protein
VRRIPYFLDKTDTNLKLTCVRFESIRQILYIDDEYLNYVHLVYPHLHHVGVVRALDVHHVLVQHVEGVD